MALFLFIYHSTQSSVCICAYSVVSGSLWFRCTVTHLCPYNFSGKNTGECCHFQLQGIFLTQWWSLCFLCLLHWKVDFLSYSKYWITDTILRKKNHKMKKIAIPQSMVFSWYVQTQRYSKINNDLVRELQFNRKRKVIAYQINLLHLFSVSYCLIVGKFVPFLN